MAYYYADYGKADNTGNGTSAATAKKDIANALALTSSGDVVFAKNGTTYAPTAGISVSGGRSLVGYATTIGDGGIAVVSASGMSGGTDAITAGDHSHVANFQVTGAKNHAFSGTFAQASFLNCGATSPGANGFDGSGATCTLCRSSGGVRGFNVLLAQLCATSGSSGVGIFVRRSAARCLSIASGSHGFDGDETASLVESVAYSSTSNGVNANSKWNVVGVVAYGNGGYGISLPSSAHEHGGFRAVAAGSNTSGNNNVLADLGEAIVSLSADPFADAAGYSAAATLADLFACFMPNSTAGGGVLLRGAGLPANLDLGAAQSAASGGSSAHLRAFIMPNTYRYIG